MSQRGANIVLALAILVSLAFFIVPQLVFIELSFHRNLGMGQVGAWIGLGNYIRVITDRFTLEVILRTVWLSALSAALALLLSTFAAYWMARMGRRAVSVLIILLLISSFVSVVVKALGLQILLGSNGVVVATLRALSLGLWTPKLLYNDFGVIIGMIQYTLPLTMLLMFGVFQTLAVSVEEAAVIHGASDLRMFRRVVLPQALHGMVVSALVAFNMNMGAFTSPALLGGGKVLTVPVLVQRMISLDLDYPDAAAVSIVLTLAVLAINLQVALLNRRKKGML